MAEDIKKVEETTEQTATVETKEEEVDYDQELVEAAEKQRNAEGYAQRHAKKDVEVTEDADEALVNKVKSALLPELQKTAEANSLEIHLDKVAGSNESLKKLVRFHLDNSVNKDLPLGDRVEAAHAIANKKRIEKTVKEINVARQNRSQISNVGQGSNQETYSKPGQNVLSDNQINKLKEQHAAWKLPGSVDDFIKKTIERMNQ